jgi:hypothetical protein
MCNCLDETIHRIKAELPEKNPSFASMKITGASFDNAGIVFDSPCSHQLTYPVTIKHEPIGRKKQTAISLLGSFCPFCGERIKKGHETPRGVVSSGEGSAAYKSANLIQTEGNAAELARGEKAEVSA